MSNIKELTWEDFDSYISLIVVQIIKSGYHPDCILSVLRGGAIPAVRLSHVLDIRNILFTKASRYSGIGKSTDDILVVDLFKQHEIVDKNILLVDDIWDHGKTINAVLNGLQYNGIKGVKVAVLVHKNRKESDRVDYCGDVVNNDDWLVFPWEKDGKNENKK